MYLLSSHWDCSYMRIAVVKLFSRCFQSLTQPRLPLHRRRKTRIILPCQRSDTFLFFALDIVLYLIKCRKESKSAVLNLRVILCHSVSVWVSTSGVEWWVVRGRVKTFDQNRQDTNETKEKGERQEGWWHYGNAVWCSRALQAKWNRLISLVRWCALFPAFFFQFGKTTFTN